MTFTLRSPLAAARDLAGRWPTRLAIAETGLPVCIQTTRLVFEAFRMAGFYDVVPLPCELIALNPQGRRSVEQKQELKGSCRVEVGPDSPNSTGKTGWQGHLILEHPTFLLDLTFAGVITALGAPGFGVVTAYCAEKHTEAALVDDVWTSVTDTGIVIMHRPRPDAGDWEQLPAWTDWTTADTQAAERIAIIIDTKAG